MEAQWWHFHAHVPSLQVDVVGWPDGRGFRSGGGFGVLQEDLEVPQELADAADRVLGLPGGLAVDADQEGVGRDEQLAAAVVVRLVDLAGGGAELAGGLDGAGRVADDEGLVVGLQELRELPEERVQDLRRIAAFDGDDTDDTEAGGLERGCDELLHVLRFERPAVVGRDEVVHLSVLAGVHGAVAHRQQNLTDVAGLDLLGAGQSTLHPVGYTAREDERVDLLRGGHRGVAERSVEGGHGVGALQPVGADVEGALAEVLAGLRDVVLERLVRGHLVDDLSQGLGGELRGDGQSEGLDDLAQDAVVFSGLTDGVEQVGLFLDRREAVATEVHDGIPSGD